MSGFASAVLLGDLNDFIAPSQACVNPLFAAPSAPSAAALPKVGLQLENDLSEVRLVAEPTRLAAAPPRPLQQEPNLIRASGANKSAKVSLSDCLACSGCVTSAETVLIEQQSAGEFDRASADAGAFDVVVVTLSGESRASLAASLGLDSVAVAQAKVDAFLRRERRVHLVLDCAVASDLALLESAGEFLHRFRASRRPGADGAMPEAGAGHAVAAGAPLASVAVSATASQLEPSDPVRSRREEHGGRVEPRSELPLLSSACPGWVCYAEKSCPECIPLVATAKSTQQVAGALIKRFLAQRCGTPPSRVYHATVMPCADKKLEASRLDFFDELTKSRDVDCVLTTAELAGMMQEAQGKAEMAGVEMVDVEMEGAAAPAATAAAAAAAALVAGRATAIAAAATAPTDSLAETWRQLGAQLAEARDTAVGAVASDGGSGGYVDYVFRIAARELFGVTVPPGPLPFRQGRNSDIRTVELHVGGRPVLRFATAYGFRNIQQVVRLIKRGKCPYDMVEIMACPSGCLNGGGQVRVRQQPKQQAAEQGAAEAEEALAGALTDGAVSRERLRRVDELFHARSVRDPAHEQGPASALYRAWVGGEPYSAQARQLLHTRYHAVPKLDNGLLEKW
jgi:iron only hydrogenase large subunit-like protein